MKRSHRSLQAIILIGLTTMCLTVVMFFVLFTRSDGSVLEASILFPLEGALGILFFAGFTSSYAVVVALSLIQSAPDRYKMMVRLLRTGLIFLILILLTLPIAKGYYFFGRDDMLTQVGYVSDVVSSGNVNSDPIVGDIYPVSHIVIAAGSILSGLDILWLFMFMPLVMYAVFYLGMRFMERRALGASHDSGVLALLALIPLFGPNITSASPSALSLYMIPLFIGLLAAAMSRRSWRFIVPMIVIVVVLPFLHPLTATFCAVAAIIGGWVIRQGSLNAHVSGRNSDTPSTPPNAWTGRAVVYLGLIASIVIIFWFVNSSLNWHISYVIESFFNIDQGSLGTKISSASKSSLPFITFVWIVLKSMGPSLILISLAIVYILAPWTRTDRVWPVSWRYPLWSSLAIVSASMTILLIITPTSVDVARGINLTALFSIVLATRMLSIHVAGRTYGGVSKWIPLRSIAAVIALVLIFSLSLGGVYRSPIILSPTAQCLESEFCGMEWIYEETPSGSILYEISSYDRFFDAAQDTGGTTRFDSIQTALAPSHLDWAEITNDGFDDVCGYFVTGDYDLATYSGVWSMSSSYSHLDITSVADVQMIDKVCDYGTIVVFRIH